VILHTLAVVTLQEECFDMPEGIGAVFVGVQVGQQCMYAMLPR
jgi:hypothetical protein